MPLEPTAEQLRAAAHLHHLRDTYPDVDRWRVRSRAVEEPQRGSELELDGQAVRDLGHTLAGQARQALIAGTQHLSLARDAIESARELYPSAHPTLIRGALVGASRGVWLLAPDNPEERQRRALAGALEMFRRLGEWIREPYNGLAEQDREQSEAVVGQSMESLQVQLRLGDAPLPRASDTDIVRFAAEATFSDAPVAGEVVALWRQLSGDAHALGWSALTRGSTQRSPVGRDARYRQPMSEVTAQGDLAEFVNDYYAAYRILRNGWGLFDRRGSA